MSVQREITANIPNEQGEFKLHLYTNSQDAKEHLALTSGEMEGAKDVLVRVHSECFTGDVLGSRRCDCNAQLHTAMDMISKEGAGILIYLRQEGRGIGLLNKLKTYNLQDEGYDTVDANLQIGRKADERTYELAADILSDLRVQSIRLLTNNPKKIDGMRDAGIDITERVPLHTDVTPMNVEYLRTKKQRLKHLLEIGSGDGRSSKENAVKSVLREIHEMFVSSPASDSSDYPTITLSYAQSLDGSIAFQPGEQTNISGDSSLSLTHGLRALHDAILVGVGTVLSDNPQLTVRLQDGHDPRPVIVDSKLRIPEDCQLLRDESPRPVIATTEQAAKSRIREVESAGGEVMVLPATDKGLVDLEHLAKHLATTGIKSLMVEGGAEIITSFLNLQLVDFLVLTVAPQFLGGLHAVGDLEVFNPVNTPEIENLNHRQVGKDLIVWGHVNWRQQ